MKLNKEEKSILKIMILNELYSLDGREENNEEDKQYIKQLENIIKKIDKDGD